MLIVETGISRMKLDYQSLEMMISMRIVDVGELNFVVETMSTHQLVSIAVIFLLMLSMMILTSQ